MIQIYQKSDANGQYTCKGATNNLEENLKIDREIYCQECIDEIKTNLKQEKQYYIENENCIINNYSGYELVDDYHRIVNLYMEAKKKLNKIWTLVTNDSIYAEDWEDSISSFQLAGIIASKRN